MSTEVLRTDESWIQKTPDVCGGEACVRRTRHTVSGLVEWRQLGLSDARILSQHPDLSQADLDAAWAYWRDHPDAVAKAIRENQED
jgi:uncharacterized protein (DUF433 family)